MELLNAKLLPKERILVGSRVESEHCLFAPLAETVANGHRQLAVRIHERLARRHALRPESLGGGIALPHASVPGLSVVRAAFVRSSIPIAMSAPDGRGVTDVLALLVPFPGLGSHYDLLMALTAWLTRTGTREALRRARTAEDIQTRFSSEAGR